MLADTMVTEMLGMAGYDFVWIDTEHSAIELRTLADHLMAARSAGTHSIVRVPWNDPIMVKRVLEQGPDGIIFPMINTVQELDQAMKSTLYPPEGTRGFGPIRAVDYGLLDIDEYIHSKSLDLIRCAQIETDIAVENLAEMAKNPWVDCFIFGPCDLSGSIGELNNVMGERTQTLIRRAIEILKDAGKAVGVSTGAEDQQTLSFWHNLGIQVISAGIDYLHIVSGAKRVLSVLDTLE